MLSESFKNDGKHNVRTWQRRMSHILLTLEGPLYSRRSSCQPCLSHSLQYWSITLETYPTKPSLTIEVSAYSIVLNSTSTRSLDPSYVLLLSCLTAAMNGSRQGRSANIKASEFWMITQSLICTSPTDQYAFFFFFQSSLKAYGYDASTE